MSQEVKQTVTPYLIVQGAAEAIDFYRKAFGAQEIMRMPGPNGKIMHATIRIGNSNIHMTDEAPSWGARSPKSLGGSPVSIHLQLDDVDAVFKQAIAAGATSILAPANMFWGDRFGKLTDPFGHVWSLAQTVENLTPEEMAKRGQEAMKNMPECP